MSSNQIERISTRRPPGLGRRRAGAMLEVADRRITMAYRPHPGKLLAGVIFFTLGGLFAAHLVHGNQRGLRIEGLIRLNVAQTTQFLCALSGISIGMAMFALAYILPQLFIHRRIVLDTDTITLPMAGFTREHLTISMAEILGATIYKRRGNPYFIRLRTARGTFAINSAWLGAKEDFFAVQVWVRTHVKALTP